jgi:hypothetical protein
MLIAITLLVLALTRPCGPGEARFMIGMQCGQHLVEDQQWAALDGPLPATSMVARFKGMKTASGAKVRFNSRYNLTDWPC